MTSPPSAPPDLTALVGERTVPQLWSENYWFRRHEIAYRGLAPLLAEVAGEGVLVEAGSGEGYGVRLLADAGAGRVAALDYDGASLQHAAATYPEPVGGRAVRANLVRLPLAPASVAAIVSLQVLEHLWSPLEFLDECARTLRTGGLLAISTPNRLTFSPGLGRGEKPRNPFHVCEFDALELLALLPASLPAEQLLGVRAGPRLTGWQQAHGNLVDAQLAGPPESWPGELAELVRSITADDFVLAPIDPDQAAGVPAAGRPEVLDLVVLARRE